MTGRSQPAAWGSRRHLSVIRLTVLTVWLILAAVTPLHLFASFTPDQFEGFGIGRLILSAPAVADVILARPVLWLVRACVIFGCLAGITSSRCQRPAMFLTCLAVLLMDAVVKGAGGFANHAQTVPVLVLLTLSILPAGACMTLPQLVGHPVTNSRARPHRQRRYTAVAAIALIVSLPYSFVGFERLTAGGLELFRVNALSHYLLAATKNFQTYPEWLPIHALKPVLNVGFVFFTLLEVSTVVMLVWRRFRLWWLVGATAMHLSTLFLMNVFFWENLLIAWAVFWPGWRYRSVPSAPPHRES